MKKVKNILAAAIIGCALLNQVKVYAYDINPALVVVEESKNNINLKVEDTNSIVKSFQVSFKVDGAKVDSIKWSENIKNNGKADFKDNNGLITVYVTSKVNLTETDGSLNIGTLVVSGNDGDKFTITPSDMKLVTLNNKSVTAATVEYDGDTEFFTEGKQVDDNKPAPSPTPGENVKPDDTVNPGETVKPGGSESTDSDNSNGNLGSGDNNLGEKPSQEDNNLDNIISNGEKDEDEKSNSLKTGDYIKASALVIALVISGVLLFVTKRKPYKAKH